MNDQLTEKDSEFTHLVDRELKNQATPGEITFLKAHVAEWRADLVFKIKKAEGQVSRLQYEMEQMRHRCLDAGKEETAILWYKYKDEKEAHIARVRGYTHVVQSKLSQIKLYKAQRATLAPTIDEDQHSEKQKKTAYGQGWSDCNNYFYLLMKEGYTLEQAHLMSMSFWNTEIVDWRKSSKTMSEKPKPFQ